MILEPVHSGFQSKNRAMLVAMKKILFVLLTSLIIFAKCQKQAGNKNIVAGDGTIKDSVIVQGLNFPWEILWGPDNFIWMTERGGKISCVNPATGSVTTVFTISEVFANGEGGLLGMILHPNFASTPQVFVAYNYMKSGSYVKKIVRYTYNGTTLINPVVIIDNIAAAWIHNGCRLLISSDLKLFITNGDAGNDALPQNASSVNGKILRLNLDGSIPSDNPVAGNPYWTLGHRNPQGLVFANNTLFSSEHGPDTDDEINIIEKGRNYGWPNVTGFCKGSSESVFCTANNVKEPVRAWTPTIATSGLDYYNNNLIPQWKNSLLLASLKDETFYQLKLNSSNGVAETNEFFGNKYGRLRDICVSPTGKVYICTSNGGNDKIIEVTSNQ